MSALIAASKIINSCKRVERRFGDDFHGVVSASKALQKALQREENLRIYGRGVTKKARSKASAAVSSARDALTAAEKRMNRSEKTFTRCLKKVK